MSTQHLDGSFSEILPFVEAHEHFLDMVDQGNARSFHVGTEEEIKKVQEQKSVEWRLSQLEDEVESLKPVESSMILIPTDAQIKRYSKNILSR